MDIILALSVIITVYGILFFFDSIFKSCAHYPYIRLLDGFGLQLSFLAIKWRTKALNRLLIRWGNSRPKFLRFWFTLGIYASLTLLPLAVSLFIYSLFRSWFGNKNDDTEIVIEAVIPGVNLPFADLGYYSITLLICSIVHELGHALAAVLEDVNLEEIGCSVFFILPVAFVRISTEKFLSISKKRTLRILCAGIWHNIVLTLVAFLFYCTLPYLFSPFYYNGAGVSVTYLATDSPLIGARGLFLGDSIIRINDCNIYDENSWFDCLKSTRMHKTAFCIDSNLVHTLDESIPLKHLNNGLVECCDQKGSTNNMCFEYLDTTNNGILELPNHVCLPARAVIEQSKSFCTREPHSCSENLYCFRPVINNSTNLFKIVCKDKNVLYLGHVSDLSYTVEVSSYISKGIFQSTMLPDILTKFLKFIIIISLGLGIINILPIMFMDGQHITHVLGQITFKRKLQTANIHILTSIITIFFTVLLFLYIIYTIYCKIF